MYRPYIQDVYDWINYYDQGGTKNKETGESTGGIGAESGSIASPVEKAVANNNKTLDVKMRQVDVNSMPGQAVVQQALAKTRRRRRRVRRSGKGKNKKKKRQKKSNKVKRKTRNGGKRRTKQRDLFD
jgi:hypothetical protein